MLLYPLFSRLPVTPRCQIPGQLSVFILRDLSAAMDAANPFPLKLFIDFQGVTAPGFPPISLGAPSWSLLMVPFLLPNLSMSEYRTV